MIGVIEYVPNSYHGNPQAACLSLLMITSRSWDHGIEEAVVEAIENVKLARRFGS
ncbi:MAG TPA: hypothetical protein VFM35_07815 [Candidatus Binatia bacterium]|nr:hypothetical protein [Candidatus Binatia bacterium]